MKRMISAILALTLPLAWGGCRRTVDEPPSVEHPDISEGVNAIENTAFHFDSYQEMIRAFTKYDISVSSYTIRDFKPILRESYADFVDRIHADQAFPQPMRNGEPITYRSREGFSNITFLVNELYGLPWIIYYPEVTTGENFYIKATYLPTSVIDQAANPTASEVIAALSPNAPNLNNLGNQHKSITQRTIALRDREVTALVYEYREDRRSSFLFTYDDMLIEIRCDPEVWDAQWFASLSFEVR